jgi:putative NADPH-quinone reductase
MQVLVVFAHPRRDSFSHAVFETTLTALRNAGHVVNSINLYEDEFDPRMTAGEYVAYRTSNPICSEQVRRYAELLTATEALVFVYPTWWWGLPAILKGWLERVLVPGVAFEFGPSRHNLVPNLTALRRIVGVTTYGSTWLYTKVFNDAGRRMLVRTVRLVCNRSTRSTWVAMYEIDASKPEQRRAFLTKIERTLAAL